jgi:hypothetical protein
LLFALAAIGSSPAGGLWALKFSALVGYPIALIIGLPLFLLMTKQGWVGASAYATIAVGFSILLIGYFIVWPVISEHGDLSQLLFPARLAQMAIIAFGAFLAVFVFWLIVRPDKSARRTQ